MKHPRSWQHDTCTSGCSGNLDKLQVQAKSSEYVVCWELCLRVDGDRGAGGDAHNADPALVHICTLSDARDVGGLRTARRPVNLYFAARQNAMGMHLARHPQMFVNVPSWMASLPG